VIACLFLRLSPFSLLQYFFPPEPPYFCRPVPSGVQSLDWSDVPSRNQPFFLRASLHAIVFVPPPTAFLPGKYFAGRVCDRCKKPRRRLPFSSATLDPLAFPLFWRFPLNDRMLSSLCPGTLPRALAFGFLFPDAIISEGLFLPVRPIPLDPRDLRTSFLSMFFPWHSYVPGVLPDFCEPVFCGFSFLT